MVNDGNREQPGRPTRARFLIAVLLFISVVINYLDRANLSVAAPQLAKDLGFDNAQKGYILAAFGWTYAALQVPGGIGIVWAVIWYLVYRYREPAEFRGANAAEISLIREGGGFVDLAAKQKMQTGFRWADFATVLSHRKLLGLYLGQFCLTSTR